MENKTINDEILASLYEERASVEKELIEIDKRIMEHIKSNYPTVAKEIGDKIKRSNNYKQGKKKSKYR